MSCTRPLTAYRAPQGKIVFNAKDGYYDRPLNLKCGQCLACRLERTRNWAIRVMHESQMHENNCFLTLTYDDANLPDDEGLDVEHWKKFAKRLRKRLGPFRYLHAGEYGDDVGERPHYHACIMGVDFSGDRRLWTTKPHPLFTSETLSSLWPQGFSTIGTLTFDSAAYVAQYCMKKINGDGEQAAERYIRTDYETGECWTVRREYATMSKRPALGKRWFEKYSSEVYPEDFVVMKGSKFRPPKYYDDLLEEEDPDLLAHVRAKRFAKVKEQADDLTPERLRITENVLEATYSQKRKRNVSLNG